MLVSWARKKLRMMKTKMKKGARLRVWKERRLRNGKRMKRGKRDEVVEKEMRRMRVKKMMKKRVGGSKGCRSG